MTKGWIIGGSLLVLLVLGMGRQVRGRVDAAAAGSDMTAAAAPTADPTTAFLHARVTTEDGDVYQGRIRWGGNEEALWGNTFNGVKKGNPWVEQLPRGQVPSQRVSFSVFGMEIFGREREVDLSRPFMVRMGDIARIDAIGRIVRVTMRSGAVVDLDRYSADDLADGVRVWDEQHGTVDLGEREIRSIELIPGGSSGDAPPPIHGTVRTAQGDFTGLIQWNRRDALATDRLDGRADGDDVGLPFESIRSIARHSATSALVTLLDGSEVVLADTPEVGSGGGGIYVDDARYGRVLVSWDAFERADLSEAAAGPAYQDFPVGQPLAGTVVTRSGERLSGRLVFDLDESETTETLDAPWQGVDYTLLFGLVRAVALSENDGEPVRVTLHGGETLELERAGDLSDANAGLLVFAADGESPAYVSWADVREIELEQP